MKSLVRFNQGMMRMPIHWQLWILLLVAINVVIPFSFVGRFEAQLVLGTMVANLMLMTLVTGLTGFSRLLGLGHFPWFLLLYFLWAQLDHISADHFLGIWIRGLMVVNALSLLMDTVDVGRYLADDREKTVQGL